MLVNLPNDVLYQNVLCLSKCITENTQVTEDANSFFGWSVALWPPLEYGDELNFGGVVAESEEYSDEPL